MIKGVQARKWRVLLEDVDSDAGHKLQTRLSRVVAMVVFDNPLAGSDAHEDLLQLTQLAADCGQQLAERALDALDLPVAAYGKAALVGTSGDVEHGAAVLHPTLGKPMRAAIGGGKALIPSTCKIGVPGTMIDLPLGPTNDQWSFAEIDTLPVSIHDAPLPHEILLAIAFSTAGRPNPRLPK
ncbi:MAG: amino acid synthesis family protein [Sulfitobacter sp.]